MSKHRTRAILIGTVAGWLVTAALFAAGVMVAAPSHAADTRDMHCHPIGVCGIKATDPAGRYWNPNMGLGTRAGQSLTHGAEINA